MNHTAARRRRWIAWTILSCLFFIPAAVARAQDYADVSAALNTTALQPGQQAALAVVLDVKPGYHAQSHAPLSDNLIKTQVVLDPSDVAAAHEPIYPGGRTESFPLLGTLSVY